MTTDTCTYIHGPTVDDPLWLGLRTFNPERNPPFVLGASSAGVVSGVSKYKTALELAYEIRALRDTREQSEAMHWGSIHEPQVLAEYARRTKTKVTSPNRMFMLREAPYIGATPDGMGRDDDGSFIVEVKCTTSRMFDPDHATDRDCFGEGPDEVPNDYLAQVNQQMIVMGVTRCDMPVLFDGNKLRIYSIPFNEQFGAYLRQRLDAFYQLMVEGEDPTPDWDHETTVDLLKTLRPVEEGRTVDMPEDMVEWYEDWREAKVAESLAAKRKEAALARLLYVMGDAQLMHVPGTGMEICRSVIEPGYWTAKDVDQATRMVGQVKRKGYVRVSERKAK